MSKQSGFTFPELVVALAVVLVLVVVAIPSYKTVKRRAEKARCIANMKVIHTGFDSYLLDKNQWPQMPEASKDWDESDFFGWWIKSLEPYGVGEESWLCPSDKVFKQRPKGVQEYAASYAPTQFNPHRYTPYKWNQPWLVERGDYHGKGGHVMMPDGSITSTQAPWGER